LPERVPVLQVAFYQWVKEYQGFIILYSTVGSH